MGDTSDTIHESPPRVYNELKPWIQIHYLQLPKRLQAVAMFVMNNPDVVALNTIATIGNHASVNPSTLVRFAKAIGYQSFSEMKAVFQTSMRHIPEPYPSRLNHFEQTEAPTQTALKRFVDSSRHSIEGIDQKINEAAISAASQKLAVARTVYIVGQGRSLPVAAYLNYLLVKLGCQVNLLESSSGLMLEKARLMQDNDALIAISFHPYSTYTSDLVGICAEQNVPLVTLTDSTLSPLALPQGMHLEVMEGEAGGFRGLSASMCLALCLAVETGKQMVQSPAPPTLN